MAISFILKRKFPLQIEVRDDPLLSAARQVRGLGGQERRYIERFSCPSRHILTLPDGGILHQPELSKVKVEKVDVYKTPDFKAPAPFTYVPTFFMDGRKLL